MEHTKVVILDIDGVLNSSTDFFELKVLGHPINEGNKVINRGHLALLQHIIEETDAKIVLSSTWRLVFSLDEIHQMFADRGFTAGRTSFIGQTPNHKRGMSDHGYNHRGTEIKAYLNDNPTVDKFVILDDINSEIENEGFIKADTSKFHDPTSGENFVHTSDNCGLKVHEMFRAIEILGRNDKAQKRQDEYDAAIDLLAGCLF